MKSAQKENADLGWDGVSGCVAVLSNTNPQIQVVLQPPATTTPSSCWAFYPV